MQDGKRRRRAWLGGLRTRFLAVFMSVYFCILAYAAWVVQQPAGTYSSSAHAKRIAPVFAAPALAYALHATVAYLFALLDRRTDKQIRALESKLRKTVSELKDSTRFQRTRALLEKYDPDFAPPPSAATKPDGAAPARAPAAAQRAAGIATAAAAGAGSAVSSALGQLWSHAAQSLIADDPALVHMLQNAQQQAAKLEADNVQLLQENYRMRERLGLAHPAAPESPPPEQQLATEQEQQQPVAQEQQRPAAPAAAAPEVAQPAAAPAAAVEPAAEAAAVAPEADAADAAPSSPQQQDCDENNDEDDDIVLVGALDGDDAAVGAAPRARPRAHRRPTPA